MRHATPPSPILEVQNLTVTAASHDILRDVSFSVTTGASVAIIGPNGAGKTTLLRALLGLIPARGTIRWAPNMRTGYVPQRFPVEPLLPATVRELFLLKAPRFWFPPATFTGHLSHELELVGLPKTILAQPLATLSGGELQRVLIAWALLTHPDVLLLDEPTAGIDIGFGESVHQLLHRVQEQRGTTILFTSHELTIVSRFADQVLCINHALVCHGTPTDVLVPDRLTTLFGEGHGHTHLHERGTAHAHHDAAA